MGPGSILIDGGHIIVDSNDVALGSVTVTIQKAWGSTAGWNVGALELRTNNPAATYICKTGGCFALDWSAQFGGTLILDGGYFCHHGIRGNAYNYAADAGGYHSPYFYGTVKVRSDSRFGIDNETIYITGPIMDDGAATGTITAAGGGGHLFSGYILSTNNTWRGGLNASNNAVVYAGAPGCLGSGPIAITNGRVATCRQWPTPNTAAVDMSPGVPNALGSNTVTVSGATNTYSIYNIGVLHIMGDSPQATVILRPGGYLSPHTNGIRETLILDGGTIGSCGTGAGFDGNQYDYWFITPVFRGPIKMRSDSFIGSANALENYYFATAIQDDGTNTGRIVTRPRPTGGYTANFCFNSTNSTWAGGLLVQGQNVYAGAPNCLGLGPVTVNGGVLSITTNASTISDNATLTIGIDNSATGRVDIAAGVNEAVRKLYLNGVEYRKASVTLAVP